MGKIAHIDILEQRESLRGPLLGSLLLHASVVSLIIFYAWLGARGHVLWGNPHALGGGGGAAPITPVSQIPLPARVGPSNPLANDTESRVPLPPKPQPKRAVKAPEPEATPIPSRKRAPERPSRTAERYQQYRAQPDRSNQMYSGVGQALSSPMYGSQMGSGGVGMGPRSAFGNRFGWYRDLLEARIAQKWHTEDVNARLQTAPPVIVTFEIERNGSIRNVRILQGSGDRSLDYSAQRAVYEAAPFPALPPGYERDSADVEIWFLLKR